MDNKFGGMILAVLIGVLTGMGIILALNTMVQTSLVPVVSELKVISAAQQKLDRELAGLASFASKETSDAIISVDKELREIKAMRDKAVRQQPQPGGDMPDPNAVYDIPDDGSYILGKADAPVTITIFSDFQCPFCSRFYPASLDAQKAFPNDVRLIVKNFPLPFHDRARQAAKAALAAGAQGKYYEMLDLILTNNTDLTDEKFKEHATKLGLNVDQFTKDLKDKDADFEKRITDDMALAGKVGVQGTPSYYLNGKATNARDLAQWKAEIESLLKDIKK